MAGTTYPGQGYPGEYAGTVVLELTIPSSAVVVAPQTLVITVGGGGEITLSPGTDSGGGTGYEITQP